MTNSKYFKCKYNTRGWCTCKDEKVKRNDSDGACKCPLERAERTRQIIARG